MSQRRETIDMLRSTEGSSCQFLFAARFSTGLRKMRKAWRRLMEMKAAQSRLTLRRVGRAGKRISDSVEGWDDAGGEEIGEIGCVGGVAEEGRVSALCPDVEDLLHGAEIR